MVELKLSRLPDRTPVKIVVTMLPELHAALQEYARAYAGAYGREEPVTELIPAMLASFLDSDRAFARWRDVSGRGLSK